MKGAVIMKPIEVVVRHRRFPDVTVMASSRTEAKVRAAIEWGCGFLEIAEGAELFVWKAAKARGAQMNNEDV